MRIYALDPYSESVRSAILSRNVQRSVITWQLLNLILGNADGHLKNISFLYHGARISLAPFYDMVCTRNYPGVDDKLALHIGGGYDPGHIGREQFRSFAREIHVGEPYVFQELERITRIVRTQIRRTRTLLSS